VVTDAAFAALGIELDETPAEATDGDAGREAGPAAADTATEAEAPPSAPAAAPVRTTRTDSKQARLTAMLQAPEGATITEIAETLEWQSHTVRGAIAGALKKKLGLDVTSEKIEGRDRAYRCPTAV